MKKASLSLSMNAIVILILAITLLGLGLTFMRGLFSQMEEKVSVVVSAQELTSPPTRDNVLTTAPGDITLRASEVGEVVIAFMSTYPGEDVCGLGTSLDAQTGGADVATLTYSKANVNMRQDQINKWTVGIKYKAEGTGLYTAKMTCTNGNDPTKDIIITFTS